MNVLFLFSLHDQVFRTVTTQIRSTILLLSSSIKQFVIGTTRVGGALSHGLAADFNQLKGDTYGVIERGSVNSVSVVSCWVTDNNGIVVLEQGNPRS